MSLHNLKKVEVLFSDIVNETEPNMVLATTAQKFRVDGKTNYRANDETWRPSQFESVAFEGRDSTGKSGEMTQVGWKAGPTTYFSQIYRYGYQETLDQETLKMRLTGMVNGVNAKVNDFIYREIAQKGALVVAQPNRLTGWNDVAECERLIMEQFEGAPGRKKYIALCPEAYVNLASELQLRQTMAGMPEKVYNDSYLPKISTFDGLKLASGKLIRAAGTPSVTTSTLTAALNYFVPSAQDINKSNIDVRYSTISVDSNASLEVGDAFTIDNVYAVSMFGKDQQNTLKTFRVVEKIGGTQLRITPALISAQGGSQNEINYQNCVVTTESATAAISVLNKNQSYINPFWIDGGVEVCPGSLGQPEAQSGTMFKKVENSYGLEYSLQIQSNAETDVSFMKVTTFLGVSIDPRVCGILIDQQL